MVSANASVTDVNRQSFASNLELLVHPSTLYVGIREHAAVRAGGRADRRRGDRDRHRRRTSLPAARSRSPSSRVESAVRERHVGRDRRRSEALRRRRRRPKPVSCSVKAGVGGQYKISAVVADDAGGRNRSELTRWVSGADAVPTRDVEQETATVVPDKDTYRPGDTAQLLVIAPFANAHGLLTVSAQRRDHARSRSTVEQRFGGRRRADRRRRHPRPDRAGRSRRAGAATARRRNRRTRSSRRVRRSRPRRSRCTCSRRTRR